MAEGYEAIYKRKGYKMNLKDKVVIITGSGRGIGKEVALHLAKLGANIVLNSINADLIDLENEIRSNGVDCITVKGDVRNFEFAEEIVCKTIEKFGKIDVLINNAGITKDTLMLRMSESDWDDVLDINLKGAFNLTKTVSKVMLKQRSGKIINVASVSGLVGAAGQANYSSSKAGLIGLTKACAKEFAPRGVTVNAIAPGLIDTDMTQKLSDAIKEEYMRNIPLKRFGTPTDVANVVSFLSSDLSNYVTGQVINIDGGMVM